MSSAARQGTGRLALILGTLTAFGPLSIDLYLPAIPAIGREFGTSTAAAQLTLSLFFVGLALGQTIYGPMSDRYGRRGPLLFGCALYTIASIGCALAPSLGSLIGLRILQAIGGCAGMVISRSVVRDLFDAQGSARMYSLLMLVMGLAPITAPLIGGQLVAAFGWRSAFWALAAFGLLCVALTLFALRESLPAERRSRSGPRAVLATYGRLLGNRAFMGNALTGGLVSAGMFAYIAGSPFVIIELYGVPPQNYGWIFGANALGLIAASQLNRRLLARFASDSITATTLLAMVAAGLTLVAAAATGFGGLAGLLPPLFVCVAGQGLIGPNTAAAAMAPHGKTAGSASALLGTLQFSLGAVAGTLVGVLHNGTALPMAAVIAVSGIAALLVFHSLAARPALLLKA
jgi:MFS transporter, DHA1 family, multidrug resistance protein